LSDLPERTEATARASSDPKIKGDASRLKEEAQNHKGLYWRQCRYQIGNARFLQNKFDLAQEDFTAFCNEFGHVAEGKGEFMVDAEYQLALCHLFQGHYQKSPEKPGDGAIERLTNYLAKWGVQSDYGSDAKYRLAICRYAAYESELCVKECEEWLATFGNKKDEILQPEVYALLGDARGALKQHAESAAAYIESYKRATTDEVLNYALFEAGKQLQKAGDWAGIDVLYTEFVKNRPEHPAAVTAIYWMGKAKAKLGNLEDAKKITIETLQKHIANPKTEGIEMMLSQLAEWSRRRPQTKNVATGDQPLPKWDAEAELANMLKPLAENPSPTAQARLAYAKGELFRIGRNVDKRVTIIGEIAEKFKPDDLSPHLLMETGDFFFAKGEVERAETAFRRLKEDFPKSERVDAGWVGLADVNFARKDYKKALELYTHAIDRLGAPWKLKEALTGQAKCWMEFASGEKDAAKAGELWKKARKQFEEVASVREWRGESTAMALYYIAEIQYRQNQFKEATAAFERVTDSQGKYPRWVARSFLRAAEGYYRQGKNEVAQKTLLKLLDPRDPKGEPDAKKIEKFSGLPELEQAKKRLSELGGTV
jgi:TolA-binding protein